MSEQSNGGQDSSLVFTGERYVPEKRGNIELEHLHRYLQACELVKGKTVLDIACGEGYGSNRMADFAQQVTGVDISAEAVAHARSRYKKRNLQFLEGDCAAIPLPDHSVDVVVSFETIEHHDRHQEMMLEIKRVLKPGGILLMSSPDKLYYSEEPGNHNEFHVKELYEQEFKDLLAAHFKNAVYFGQRVLYGSAILSDGHGALSTAYRYDDAGNEIVSSSGIGKPLYWIALASDSELPDLAGGIFEQPLNDSEVVVELRQMVAERNTYISNLEQAVELRDRMVAEREERITGLELTVIEYRDQLDAARNQIGSYEFDLTNMLNSTSWKVTAPLRAAGRLARRVKNVGSMAVSAGRTYGYLNCARKAMRVLRTEGVQGLKWRLKASANSANMLADDAQGPHTYEDWIRLYDTLTDESRRLIRQRIDQMAQRPRFSIIMPVYNPPIEYLKKAIDSVVNQLYPDWELCIADDCSTQPGVVETLQHYAALDSRIRLVLREENGHISRASNSALELATGDFVAMFDHDDELPEHALYLVAEELNECPDADFIYSDQDKIDENGKRFDPYFKPDFNPDLLRSQNFVDHLAVFRTSIVKELGGWRPAFDGSQDYDMVLRVTERTDPARIRHIPHVLYHWRALPGSLAIDPDAKNYAAERSREALREHLQRMGIEAEVTSDYPNLSVHRVVYPLAEEPLVSIIIPTKDGVDILKTCVDGILNETDYQNFEVIIVDNQSREQATRDYLDGLRTDPRFTVLEYDKPFNYSEINNLAVKHSKGSVLAFLNNDLEVIARGWLREMVSHALRPGVGAVGARLYYPDDTVQHAGVLVGYKGRAGHMFRYAPRHWMGYWARAVLTQNLTAVTAACLVVRKEVFEEVGGFDAEHFSVTFNDVDLCLRIHEQGYRNVYAPHAELYHHESKTRGTHAFSYEEEYFSQKWRHYVSYDPAYNPNLSLEHEDFSLAFPPRVTHPWVPGGQGDPLVSIIVRTHGERQQFLKEALDSIFRQTYRPIQIVVVEDGGENARRVVNEADVPEGITLDYFPAPKNGRCFAGNLGLQNARGTFFGFLDDDDLFLPDHVESLVRQLQLKDGVVGAYAASYEATTDVRSLHPLKYIETARQVVGRAEFSLSALWNYNYMPIQALLLRREAFEQFGGLSEELDCLEDWDLWLRYTAEKDLVFVDRVTSLFRMPASTQKLEERREQHLSYLPVLRQRQAELLARYEGTPHYERLKAAQDTVSA